MNCWSMNGGWCDMMVWVLFMLVTSYGFVFLTNSLMRFNDVNGKYLQGCGYLVVLLQIFCGL